MKIKKWMRPLAMLAMAGAVSGALAAPIPTANITINGSLTDWGVTLLNNNGSNIRPNAVAPGSSSPPCSVPSNPAWACEDTDDNASISGLVGPQYGGQDYDVEFLGAALGTGVNSNTLFVGIASGLRPDNGMANYGPGDLFIKVNGVAYVIEMGGGIGGGSGAAQLNGEAGSNYTLAANGHTTAHTSLADQVVGSIWKVADGTTTQTSWATAPTQWLKGSGATQVGLATLYSTRDSLGGAQNQHAVIELGLDLALFPSGSGPMTIDELRWDPSCFNDILSISGTIPEPSSLLLVMLGMAGFAGLRRRTQKARAAG